MEHQDQLISFGQSTSAAATKAKMRMMLRRSQKWNKTLEKPGQEQQDKLNRDIPSTTFLSDKDANTTICGMCENYLSVPPIIISENNIVCGRCVNDHQLTTSNRAHFYENLAKFMFFPCKNNVYGCSAKIPWGKVLDHENICTYERMICPAINCESEIGSDEIIKHFQISHSHLILHKNECHLSQEDEHFCKNRILIWEDELYIVQTKADGDGNIFIRICNIRGKSNKISIQLKNKLSSSSLCLDKFEVMKYESNTPNFSENEKIEIRSLRNILGNDISATFVFNDIAKVPQDKHNIPLYREMECPICITYMRPPIYMCNTGHSICQHCIKKLQKCPTCSFPFGNGRNYSLEKIAQIVNYPCRNKDQGCRFLGHIDDITNHESKCSVSESEICCMDFNINCGWRGNYATALRHFSETHTDLCFKVESFCTINIYNGNIRRFLLYDKKMFLVNINLVQPNGITTSVEWEVSCITKENILDRYMYFLEIIRGNRILSVNGNCDRVEHANMNNIPYKTMLGCSPRTYYSPRYGSSSSNGLNSLKSSCLTTLSKTLLDDFIQQNMITFRINITNHSVHTK